MLKYIFDMKGLWAVTGTGNAQSKHNCAVCTTCKDTQHTELHGVHTVLAGDTVHSIGRAYFMRPHYVRELNPSVNEDCDNHTALPVGAEIKVCFYISTHMSH